MSTVTLSIRKRYIEYSSPIQVVFSIIIAIYLTAVSYFTLFSTLKFIVAVIPLFLAYFIIAGILHKGFKEYAVQYQVRPCSGNSKLWLAVFAIIFAGQLLYWLSYYPGGFNLDAYGQWEQAHGNIALNNWHPVFTTAIYWVLTRISDHLAFCIFVQLFAFSVSIAFLIYELHKSGVNEKISVVLAIFIGFCPSIGMNNVCLYKDVFFSIECIWIFFFLLKIYRTDARWIKSYKHCLGLITVLVASVLTRHNGIFLVIPLLCLLALAYRKLILRWGIIIALLLASVALIEGPVYDAFNVESHSNVVGEIVGVPMALIVNAYVNDSENVPDDIRVFLEDIATRDDWETCYYVGEWDSCKWEFGGTELFQDTELTEILSYALEAVVACPDTTYESIRENTRVVWQAVGYSYWNTWVYIEDNDYGIVEGSVPLFREISNALLSASNTLSGATLVWNIGFWIVCMLVMIIYIVSKQEYQKLVFIIPILAYVFLTMLLLCGPSHRYFYFVQILAAPILIVGGWIKKDVETCIPS